MNPDHREVFRELEPPTGGAERFRQRLAEPDGDARAPFRRLLIPGVAVASLVVVAFIALWQTDPSDDVREDLRAGEIESESESELENVLEPQRAEVFESPEFGRLLGRTMEPLETSVVINDAPVALTEIPGATPGIRIYQIRTN